MPDFNFSLFPVDGKLPFPREGITWELKGTWRYSPRREVTTFSVGFLWASLPPSSSAERTS
jgi:hypothetical protein